MKMGIVDEVAYEPSIVTLDIPGVEKLALAENRLMLAETFHAYTLAKANAEWADRDTISASDWDSTMAFNRKFSVSPNGTLVMEGRFGRDMWCAFVYREDEDESALMDAMNLLVVERTKEDQ